MMKRGECKRGGKAIWGRDKRGETVKRGGL